MNVVIGFYKHFIILLEVSELNYLVPTIRLLMLNGQLTLYEGWRVNGIIYSKQGTYSYILLAAIPSKYWMWYS